MKTLVWGVTFKRALKQVTRRHPELQQKVERALEQLVEDPFHPKLHRPSVRQAIETEGIEL
jgi:mRNA-degrading endonuclease YafQ of YafQ-DinJ toxin-antitoxin module